MNKQRSFESLRRLLRQAPSERVGPPIRQRMWERALESSLDFVEQHLEHALLFDARSQLHAYALTKMPAAGLILEFGVFNGDSINALADALALTGDPRRIVGFDSFEGLGEDWVGHEVLAGTFDRGGVLPEVRGCIDLIAGWVADTLPDFLATTQEDIALMHIDTDTYTPCKQILELTRSRLRPGSIIVFDELLAYPGWQYGEYKALCESIHSGWDYIAFSGHHAAVMMR